jgi:hypothetical protein
MQRAASRLFGSSAVVQPHPAQALRAMQRQQQQLCSAHHVGWCRLTAQHSHLPVLQQQQLHRLTCMFTRTIAGSSTAARQHAGLQRSSQLSHAVQQQHQRCGMHTLSSHPQSTLLFGGSSSSSSSSSRCWQRTSHISQAAAAAGGPGVVRSMATIRQLLRGARQGKPKRRDGTPALAGGWCAVLAWGVKGVCPLPHPLTHVYQLAGTILSCR